MMRLKIFLLLFIFGFAIQSCKKDDGNVVVNDIQETAQQVGDIMASVDESGGSAGGYASLRSQVRSFARQAPAEVTPSFFEGWALPRAEAALCSVATTFGSCSAGTITRSFGDCSIGSFLTLAGTVVLNYTQSSCLLSNDGDNVTRVPDFVITGRRGGSLTVSKTGLIGQRVTRLSATSFTFTSDGIRRVIVAGGQTLFDFTTTTTGTGLIISGGARSGRVIGSGTIRVLNNETDISCDYTPTAVTYDASCNCAITGSWAGLCSDNVTSTLSITGCGTGDFSLGTQSEPVTFDRCYSL